MTLKPQILSELASFSCISAQSKVQLFLAAIGIKPVSWINITNKNETEKLINWLTKVGLYYLTSTDDSSLIFVSKNKTLLSEANNIAFSNTKESIIKKCLLFGYPEQTALAHYSFYYINPNGTKNITGRNIHPRNDFSEFPFDYLPYLCYTVRLNHEIEDMETAKKWYDIVKKDAPELDKQLRISIQNLE